MNLNKLYKGEIVSIDDPKNEWRIKADIKGLFSLPDDTQKIEVEALPWIYPMFNGYDSGYTPKVGQSVIIEFNGDIRTGRYRSIEEMSDELAELISADYEGYKSIVHDSEEELNIRYSRSKGVEVILGASHIRVEKGGAIRHSFNDGERVIELNSNGVSILSDKIYHGSIDSASEPCVMGDVNKNQLDSIWEAIEAINQNLDTFGTIQQAVSMSVLSPLKAGFKALSQQAKSDISNISSPKGKTEDTLSKVNKLD